MDKTPKYPGYTALLPPRVRYDKELPAAAKLLYGEITAMTDVTGFCWASNAYLAQLLGVSKDRAARLIKLLEERGYVEAQVLRDEKQAVIERRIYVTGLGLCLLPPPIKNTGRGGGKNTGTPPCKNTDKNDYIDNNIPPIVPQGGRPKKVREIKATADWAPADFEALWRWYPTCETAMHSKRGNRQRAIRAWDRLRPSPELVDLMADALSRQAMSAEWQDGIGIPHLSTWLNNAGWEGWTEEDDGDGG